MSVRRWRCVSNATSKDSTKRPATASCPTCRASAAPMNPRWHRKSQSTAAAQLLKRACANCCGRLKASIDLVPGTQTQKYRNMKVHLHTHAVVANPRHSYGYVCGLRLGLGANPSLSFCFDTSVSAYWGGDQLKRQDLRQTDRCHLGPACVAGGRQTTARANGQPTHPWQRWFGASRARA